MLFTVVFVVAAAAFTQKRGHPGDSKDAAAAAVAVVAAAFTQKEGHPEDSEDAHSEWRKVEFCPPHRMS